MSKPLFSVGESVILQSKNLPQYNGEYVVERILFFGDIFMCRATRTEWQWIPESFNTFSYILNESFLPSGRVHEAIWKQSSLRKKHQKGDMNFQELMQNLNNPVKQDYSINSEQKS